MRDLQTRAPSRRVAGAAPLPAAPRPHPRPSCLLRSRRSARCSAADRLRVGRLGPRHRARGTAASTNEAPSRAATTSAARLQWSLPRSALQTRKCVAASESSDMSIDGTRRRAVVVANGSTAKMTVDTVVTCVRDQRDTRDYIISQRPVEVLSLSLSASRSIPRCLLVNWNSAARPFRPLASFEPHCCEQRVL